MKVPRKNPTPDEIEERCAEIQNTWDEETRICRKYGLSKKEAPKGWIPPLIKFAEWCEAINESYEGGN